MSATVQGVDHVQLPVPPGRLAQARAFYETLLGLPEVRDPLLDRPGTLRFSLGWQRLDLSEGLYTGVAPQAHIALRVHGLDALARTVTAAGHRIEVAPLPSGEHRFYVEDPFGNRLELIEPAADLHAPLRGHRVSTAQFSV